MHLSTLIKLCDHILFSMFDLTCILHSHKHPPHIRSDGLAPLWINHLDLERQMQSKPHKGRVGLLMVGNLKERGRLFHIFSLTSEMANVISIIYTPLQKRCYQKALTINHETQRLYGYKYTKFAYYSVFLQRMITKISFPRRLSQSRSLASR